MNADEPREHLDHAARADAAGNIDGQALAGVLIDPREALQLLAVGTGVEDKVIGPDLVRAAGSQRPRARYAATGRRGRLRGT